MPSLVYHEGPAEPFIGDPNRLDAVKHYMKHFDNLLLLTFIEQKSKSGLEKAQASKEIAIAKRKLAWWKNHPRYDHSEVMRRCEQAKKVWAKAG